MSTELMDSTQPVMRVTAPAVEPEGPKIKDPKKVEAGRIGAAARKAKQERLLDELREAKSSLLATPRRTAVQAKQDQRNQEASEPKNQTEQQHYVLASHNAASISDGRSTGTACCSKQDWTPYVVGGLGVTGALWLLWSSRNYVRSSIGTTGVRVRTASHTSPPSVVVHAPVAPINQLKIQHDPFIMQ
jgi:hypothetical protein